MCNAFPELRHLKKKKKLDTVLPSIIMHKFIFGSCFFFFVLVPFPPFFGKHLFWLSQTKPIWWLIQTISHYFALVSKILIFIVFFLCRHSCFLQSPQLQTGCLSSIESFEQTEEHMAFKQPARAISGLQDTILRGSFVGGPEANKVKKPGSWKHEVSFLTF